MEGPGHERSGGQPGGDFTREGAEALIGRIERALGEGALDARALAFDADGTLWDGDVGVDLFEAFLAARGARAEVEAALRGEAEAFGVAVADEPGAGGAHAAARALYDAFSAERYPEDRAFPMMAWAFTGWTEDEMGAFAERVLEEGRIDARIRPALRRVLDWASSRSIDVFVVSASPRAIVERGVRRLGIPASRVHAMTPAIRDGRLAPELALPATYGDGKVRALERALPSLSRGAASSSAPSPLLAAFGDSAYDAAMLRVARVPVAVTPSPGLLALTATLPGLIVLDL